MRKIGLRPDARGGYLQPFEVVPVRLDRERSAIVVRRGDQGGESFAVNAVFFPNPPTPIDAELAVAFAGFGITAPEIGYDDYAGLEVRGKAVLVFDHEPRETDPGSPFNGTGLTLHANAWTKTRNAQDHGASALIMVTEPTNAHRSAPRAPDRANAPQQALVESELRIPRFSVPREAADALVRGTGRTLEHLQSAIERGPSPSSLDLAGVRVRLQAANAESGRQTSWNVAGLLPGYDPRLRDETILVTSHYDHLGFQNGKLYAGANDNASGVAAMLETARVLAAQPPARSVMFVSFGSEEQLMLGSYFYVAHPLRPLAATRAVLNLDMVGRNEEQTPESEGAYQVTAGRSNELNLVGTPYRHDLQMLLDREGRAVGMSLSDKFDRDWSMRALFRCDHLPFLQKGIPAVWLFGGFHPGYHEPVDTVDRLDFDKMTRVVRLTAQAAVALANGAAVPRFSSEPSRTPPSPRR